jgi:hypothetical protein
VVAYSEGCSVVVLKQPVVRRLRKERLLLLLVWKEPV